MLVGGRRLVDEGETPAWHDEGEHWEPYIGSGVYERCRDALPDLTDPATLGCLLALVREAWQDPTITTHCWRVSPAVVARSPERGPERWSAAGAPVERLLLDPDAARDWQAGPGWDDTRPADILSGARCPNFRGPSEPAALVAALEAACQE